MALSLESGAVYSSSTPNNSDTSSLDQVTLWLPATYETWNTSGQRQILYLTPFTTKGLFDYIIQMVLALLIVLINSFVMYILATTSSLYTPTHFIIWSLALSDFGMGLTRPLESLLELEVLKDYRLCLFSYCSTVALGSVSMQHLTLVSVDRYIRIKRPFHYRDILSRRRVVFISVVLWTICFVFSFLPTMGFRRSEYDGSSCSAEYIMEPWFFFLAAGVSFFLCSVVLTYIYFKIFLIARNKRKFYVSRCIKRRHMSSAMRNLKAAKFLAVLSLYFLLSWAPFFSLRFAAFLGGQRYEPSVAERVAATVAVGNSLGNPILYAYGDRNVGIVMKKVILKLKYPKARKPVKSQARRPGMFQSASVV